MQELHSRNAGIRRKCDDMHGENAGFSANFVTRLWLEIQEIPNFLVKHRVKRLELLGLCSGRAPKSTETQKELK